MKFNLLYLRLIASHIAVAALTMLILIILYLATTPPAKVAELPWYSDPRLVAHDVIRNWLIGVPDGQPNGLNQVYIPGFALVVSASDAVLYSQGDTGCRAEMLLGDCAPDLLGILDERLVDVGGQHWPEVTIPLVDGTRIISRREPVPAGELLAISNSLFARGQVQFMALLTVIVSIVALPLALLAVWWGIRPQVRRLLNIARMSRDFAEGDFQARVNDPTPDEIGDLARQFDDMVAILEQNITVLQDLVQRNDRLAQQAEQSAVRAERLRLARDLHDSIAQRLFSVSMTAAGLPNLIQTGAEDSHQKASLVAALANEALDDLRAVMVDVRPVSVIERGLGEALERLCEDWHTLNHIPLERSFLLSGAPIPPAVEDVLYRVAQEALNNVAKHGGAESVQILLVQGQQHIMLSVSDNGCGFDMADRGTGRGFGLMGMRERAIHAGGELNIESCIGRGTTVQLVVATGRAD